MIKTSAPLTDPCFAEVTVPRSEVTVPCSQRATVTGPAATLLQFTALACTLLASGNALAGAATFAQTNVQYLTSNQYEYIYFNPAKGGLDSRTESAAVMTIEHVNEWKYGDNFLFIDVTNPDRSTDDLSTGYYGEFSPRFSLGKISGKGVGTGLVKDVLVTTTAEIGQGFRNYLYGVALDLNLPNTPVFQINYYARNEVTKPNADMGSQVTLVWLKPFAVGNVAMSFEGFFDYAWGMDHVEDNIITAPRLLVDLGQFWNTPGMLQAGIEYQIWRNKFGIDGIDEDVVQAMVKWIW